MNQIAVLSDVTEVTSDNVLCGVLDIVDKVWYIKLVLPGSETKWSRYHKTGSRSGSLSDSAIHKRREVIQERINELSQQGFAVNQKYISLFMSRKINELILTKQRMKRFGPKVADKKSIEVVDDSLQKNQLKQENQYSWFFDRLNNYKQDQKN